jgi:hypothetical protein
VIFQISNNRADEKVKNGSSYQLAVVGNDLLPGFQSTEVLKHGVKSHRKHIYLAIWTNVKVEVNKGDIKVYVDGKHVDSDTLDSPGAPFHFKFGAYSRKRSTTRSARRKFSVIWESVRVRK